MTKSYQRSATWCTKPYQTIIHWHSPAWFLRRGCIMKRLHMVVSFNRRHHVHHDRLSGMTLHLIPYLTKSFARSCAGHWIVPTGDTEWFWMILGLREHTKMKCVSVGFESQLRPHVPSERFTGMQHELMWRLWRWWVSRRFPPRLSSRPGCVVGC